MKDKMRRPKMDHGKSGSLEMKKVKIGADEVKSCVHNLTKPMNRNKREIPE